MTKTRKLSRQTRAVLLALFERPSDWRYGYDLMQRTGIASGTLYPMLMRLFDQGNLEAKWVPSSQEGRPLRHACRLTGSGVMLARDVLRSHEGIAMETRGFAI